MNHQIISTTTTFCWSSFQIKVEIESLFYYIMANLIHTRLPPKQQNFDEKKMIDIYKNYNLNLLGQEG